ncbi:MAG: hypothetical protein AAB527_03555 [Patescibacteria group bacterium]
MNIVNKFLVNLILLGFVGIAVFGFLAMGHDAAARGACLAMTFNRSACPSGISETISFYASAFKSFSLAVLTLGLNLAAVGIIFGFSLFIFSVPTPNFSQFSFLKRFSFATSILAKKNLTHWLSLHENSPSFV